MTRDDGSRYLILRMTVLPTADEVKRARAEFRVVHGFEVADYEASGWRVVVEDPEPNRYAPWARSEEDGA